MQKSDRLVLVLLVGGVLVLLLWMMRGANMIPSGDTPMSGFGKGPGEIAPPIQAEGWINGPGPTAESLRGKVIVLDAWEHWCGPCLQKAPELVALYHKFEGEDVVFLGLTTEGTASLSKLEEFSKRARFEWPTAYGAVGTSIQLGSNYVPSVWVIGRDGKITWNMGYEYIQPLESAIEQALAAPPAGDAPQKTTDKPADDAKDPAVSAESEAR